MWSKEERRALEGRIEDLKGHLEITRRGRELKRLEQEMEKPSFWEEPKRAQELTIEANALRHWVKPFLEMERRFLDAEEIYEEARDDTDLLSALDQELQGVKQVLEELEIKRMLSGEMDARSCFLAINAGAGGTESCDWVDLLGRMYERYGARKHWTLQKVDRVEGEVAGSKSITYKIEGAFAYGYCKSEHGVHRLVRISPFDSQGRRHTSFASVEVLPMMDETQEDEIRSDDLRIETFRASGAGGQHVNKTDSAVRITHLPTKIVVTCQNERSQLQNKETCMKMLKAKLFEIAERERQEKMNALKGEQREIAWGSQIRSYVFQPYTLVKDLRTQVEMGDVQAVMDGEIEPFIEAYLKRFGG